MSELSLKDVVKLLLAPGKGILAADESTLSIKNKFEKVGVEDSVENHRLYRQMFFTTPHIENYISGVIMYDETIRQKTDDIVPFPRLLDHKGILVGIKVDLGTKEFAKLSEEKITVGLEGLDSRLKEYYVLGARFAKWRAVIKIGKGIPTKECIESNANFLAQYSKICQQNKIVPIVEPEVLMDGDHDIKKCFEVTKLTLKTVFEKLAENKVDLKGLLLKPNMVMPGANSVSADSDKVAEYTVSCFEEVLPRELPGIVFLSGGQTEAQACENLSAIVKRAEKVPWKFTFSFGRALQDSALKTWNGEPKNVKNAQDMFLLRASLASAASLGKYDKTAELA